MACLCATTRLVARSITRLYEAELREAGLLAPQFWLLSTLSAQEDANQRSLWESMAMDQTTLSRNLAVVVRNGWVRSESSGRERRYALTYAGQAKLSEAKPYWKRAQEKMQKTLGSDWESVWKALDRVAKAAQDANRELADSSKRSTT
ncbi:MAG TPA: MarR family winged helix-turn-helix transcriptional regulator [Bryobacteraceae bacterium]|jgi:DNA-binding MarR family transcriptional regulator|nr:MarR family winged helix-turn-helix transcriptional regulator [Bryobacteraceae bacterium]